MRKQKVCWQITTKCNQNCKFCFGFNNIKELHLEENKKVLTNLVRNGVTNITWTGGEAILYPELNILIKEAKKNGVHNKLVTNGIYLAKNNNSYTEEILNNLDELNLSIDSISNEVNEKLGKQKGQYKNIKEILERIKNKKIEIKVNINTVISKKNENDINELGEFLNNYDINTWKFLKFMPIRERAIENKEQFETTEKELKNIIKDLKNFKNIKKLEYKNQKEFEKSIQILPNADIIKTQNGIDKKVGNALKQDIINFEGINTYRKIRTLIAYDDLNVVNNIERYLNSLDFVEVVAKTVNNIDTYSKILELKPEMVFAKFDIGIMKEAKKILNDETPTFNILADGLSMEEIDSAYEIIGEKLNALVEENDKTQIINIMQEYKEYKT